MVASASPDQLLRAGMQGQMILAPLTRGGNLPFRRLCADFGMRVGVGEMVFARMLLNDDKKEKARLRRAANEGLFGVQIATNDVEEGVRAVALAAEAGADWVDLNCGCPIYEATRRGLGSALLRKPDRLATLVRGISERSVLPLTVKVRTASVGDDVNVRQVVAELRKAGAAAVTVHGRTAEQRYSKAADWGVIAAVVGDGVEAGSEVPIIGNGDVQEWYEARRRLEETGVHAVMVGRAALTKPWMFDEFDRSKAWEPDVAERVAVWRKLACYMKEHFRDDARGKAKAWYFLPWHIDFLSRYQPYPPSEWEVPSRQSPLIQTRRAFPPDLPPLDRLLSHPSKEAHELIAHFLWDATSDAEALCALQQAAEAPGLFSRLAAAQQENKAGDAGPGEVEELANVGGEEGGAGPAGSPGGKARKGKHGRPRAVPVIRTEGEIAEIRAARAAKRELTGAPPHQDGRAR